MEAQLNTTGTTLCKLWDQLCIPDDPTVKEIAARMDLVVKGYCRGDTRLLAAWVKTAAALSDACVKAGGEKLPAEFLMAPVVVAKGVTAAGTKVPPPAVIVTTQSEDPNKPPVEKEVAVLVDGSQTAPHPALPPPDATKTTVPAQSGGGWGIPLLVVAAIGAVWILS